jgi:hypothetical protein
MKVVDEHARLDESLHFCKQSDGVFPVEVVEKQCGVRDTERPLLGGGGEGVARVHGHAGTKPGGQMAVEVGPGVAHRGGIGVQPDRLYRALELNGPTNEVHQVVA